MTRRSTIEKGNVLLLTTIRIDERLKVLSVFKKIQSISMAYSHVRSELSNVSFNQGMNKGSETEPKHSQDVRGHFEVKLSIDSAHTVPGWDNERVTL